MRISTLTLLATLLSAPAFASAGTLSCWKTDFHPRTPFLTATVVKSGVLADVTFNYRNSGLDNVEGNVRGEEITSSHSPYKGSVRYVLKGAGELILPEDLSNDNLLAVETKGIGYYKNENGVLITYNGDGESGGHVSYRLSCRSDF